MKRILLATVLALIVVSPVTAGRGPETPEVDWFSYSVARHAFRWQTFEEYMVRGFTVEYAPASVQGLVTDPPVSLWSSGYIFAQRPGTMGGAQYDIKAPRAARMHEPLLCTWYSTWWRCDIPATVTK